MFNDRDARCDVDYAAYLVRVAPDTLEEAVMTCGCVTEPTEATDYFVFYQDDGRWAWRRVNKAETVVEASNAKFRFYLQCVADARQHGWSGKPLSLFSASGFSRCTCPKLR